MTPAELEKRFADLVSRFAKLPPELQELAWRLLAKTIDLAEMCAAERTAK